MPSGDAASEVEPLVYKVSTKHDGRTDSKGWACCRWPMRIAVVAVTVSIVVVVTFAAMVMADEAKTAADEAKTAAQHAARACQDLSGCGAAAAQAQDLVYENWSQAFIQFKALRQEVLQLQQQLSLQATTGSQALSPPPAAAAVELPGALRQLPAALQNISELLERVGQATSKTDQALHGGKLRLVLD